MVEPTVTYESYVRGLNAIRKDPAIRITTSPLGLTDEEYATHPPKYVGDAVPWKGHGNPRKGMGVPSFITEKYPGLAKAIGKIIRISKAYANVKGTTHDSKGRLLTKKNVAQMNWKTDHPELER